MPPPDAGPSIVPLGFCVVAGLQPMTTVHPVGGMFAVSLSKSSHNGSPAQPPLAEPSPFVMPPSAAPDDAPALPLAPPLPVAPLPLVAPALPVVPELPVVLPAPPVEPVPPLPLAPPVPAPLLPAPLLPAPPLAAPVLPVPLLPEPLDWPVPPVLPALLVPEPPVCPVDPVEPVEDPLPAGLCVEDAHAGTETRTSAVTEMRRWFIWFT
jgi:hypothetical protein